jgi:hypothetical protein
MRLNSIQLIKFCGTLTVSSRDRVSRATGRRAVVMVFASPSGQFYRVVTNPAHLSGPRRQDSFIVTPKLIPTYRDWQKTQHLDADGNSLMQLVPSLCFDTLPHKKARSESLPCSMLVGNLILAYYQPRLYTSLIFYHHLSN